MDLRSQELEETRDTNPLVTTHKAIQGSPNAPDRMEEIFLDMEVMMTMTPKMMMKVTDLMVIPVPHSTDGAIYAGSNAFQLRSAS
eukprot:4145196-Amphidinium_carterae.1